MEYLLCDWRWVVGPQMSKILSAKCFRLALFIRTFCSEGKILYLFYYKNVATSNIWVLTTWNMTSALGTEILFKI